MWRNYLISSWRTLLRQRSISLIHILGLAAGLSAAILIFLYVESELQYDKHHPDAARIYRLNSVLVLDGQTDRVAKNSLRAAPELMAMYPDIESYCRVVDIGKQSIWYGTKMFSEDGVCFADSTYFNFFKYRFAVGDAKTCLDQPMQMAISEETAIKYFGSVEEAMGKSLQFTQKAYQVSAVFVDGEAETQLPFSCIISLSSMNRGFYQNVMGDYFRMMSFTYLKLVPGADAGELASKFKGFYTESIKPWIDQNEVNGSMSYILQPLQEVHLSNDFSYDFTGNSNKRYIQIFSIVGFFLLVVAAINYMNLSTARSGKRAKEVGIRMVAGAKRSQLIFQFLLEALLHSFIALIFALATVEILFPYFNALTDKSFDHADLFRPDTLGALLLLCLLLALVSGSYPAFFLSSIKPLEVIGMKSGHKKSFRGWKRYLGPVVLRRTLVVMQFAISIALIVSTSVVIGQLTFMKNKDLGFDKEGVLVIPVPGDSTVQANLPRIKNEFLKRSEVEQVASASAVPGGLFGKLYFIVDHAANRSNKILGFMFIDDAFIPMMKLELEGRNFDPNNAADPQSAFIINRACADFLGWEDPIGKEMENGFGLRGRVIGVVEDFNYNSLHAPIEPMVMMYQPNNTANLLIKVKSQDGFDSYEALLNQWRTLVPKHPLEAYFLDDFMNRRYLKEGKMLRIFSYFTTLAVFISCLGLFGLASFSTELRTKEIGIRKVLGASTGNITLHLTYEFILLVLFSNLLAWPAAWYFLQRWLESFAYAIDLSVWPFLWSSFLALLVAALTVTGLSVRAAQANPVKALRYE